MCHKTKGISQIGILIVSLITLQAYADQKQLYIYNWSDYMGPETISQFEQKTGIKVTYDTFNSNEELEHFLMTQPAKYDLVVPTSNFLAKQIDANIYQPLDKTKLPSYLKNLDPDILEMVSKDDPENTYSLPYMWISTGIGYNVDELNKRFNNAPPVDSWALLFEPNNAEKLADCGIAWLEAPSELFALALNYLGLDPNSATSEDYVKVSNLLSAVSPYVRYIDSTNLIDDLASGKVCVAIGWSGDIYQAMDKAAQSNNGIKIDYVIPKEGTFASFDVFAIPKTAKNVDEAYQFLNYLLEPKVIADISNYVYYANPNLAATQFVDEAIAQDPNIYPPKNVLEHLFALTLKSPRIERAILRTWADILESRSLANLSNEMN
nr:polyamine ABC transporter substrate-binding protein [Thorsellia anophelis]